MSGLLHSRGFRKIEARLLLRNLDVVGLEVFFTAFDMINLGDEFSLGSFRMACSLGMRFFFESGGFLFLFEYWAVP